MKEQNAAVPQEVLDLYDQYCHDRIDRREFVRRLGSFAVGGITLSALLARVMPAYAEAQQVREDDARVKGERVEYASPQGAGKMSGYLVRPAGTAGKLPAVLVIHENRGLNPHIADVARRTALAGYLAFAPDALFPLGGYPGNDDDGRSLQKQRDPKQMEQDFEAAARWLLSHEGSDGRLAIMGFCWGGMMTSLLACRVAELKAAVPFYGSPPPLEEIPKIQAPLLVHLASLDTRINEQWPAHEAALKQHGKQYEIHMYEGANHGFHNDTTPRYDDAAAKLAWQRTTDFLAKHLPEEAATTAPATTAPSPGPSSSPASTPTTGG